MRKRLIPLLICGPLVAVATSCTPREVAMWKDWHAKDPAAAEAFARRLPSSPPTPHSGINWDAVARCESGGQWSHPLVTNHVGTFGGGLMIMLSAWRQYGGLQFASTPGGASRAEQIIVAERIAAKVGADRAWECPVPRY